MGEYRLHRKDNAEILVPSDIRDFIYLTKAGKAASRRPSENIMGMASADD
jgi:hypothetical protein